MCIDFPIYLEKKFVTFLKVNEAPHLVEIACKTCWTAGIEPVAILIRSHIHNTQTKVVRGGKMTIPDEWHITISVKDEKQAESGDHTTYHGYVVGKKGKTSPV